jgi:hypothetical protein
MSGGFYLMQRGWADRAIFAGEPYDKRSAWVWLIENAAFAPHDRAFDRFTISLARGQLAASQRYLAKAWTWPLSRVCRFLKRLSAEGSISCVSAVVGRNATRNATRNAHTCVSETPCETPPSVITICNYEAYQFQLGETETPCETPPNGEVKRHPERHPEQTINKGIRKGNDNGASAPTASSNARGNGRARGPYVFQGEYIRLNAVDLAKLKTNYPAIPDLNSELHRIDATFVDEPPKDRKWWGPLNGKLNAKHQIESAKKLAALKPATGTPRVDRRIG